MLNSFRKFGTFALAIVIIAVASALSYYWLTNKPRASRQPAPPVAPLVDIMTPPPFDHPITIHALGTVIAAQSVNLNSRVDGIIIAVSKQFIEGGLLNKGEEIVRLDPTDYELRLRQAQSELTRAHFNLKMELGQQAIAQREYQLLGQELDALAEELVQRKPHLEAAKASVRAAEAALEQAELNLNRTRTIAPFNAVVTERNANVGSWISTFSTGTPLVKLVSTDFFWIDVSLPIDKLRWLSIPGFNADTGSSVIISDERAWGPDAIRVGTVKRLKAEVEPEGRMAKLLVEIEDPLGLQPDHRNAPHLMLGTLVRTAISGQTLTDVLAIPETALHDGRQLWLLNDDNTLNIAPITPVWSEQGTIYIPSSELPERPRVIVSDLSTPVQGMRLRTAETEIAHPIR